MSLRKLGLNAPVTCCRRAPCFSSAFFSVAMLATVAMLAGVSAATPAEVDSETASTEPDAPNRGRSHSVPPPPIGVRFGEPLEGQQFRVAYRFERIQKQGLLVGNRDKSPREILSPNSFHPYDRTPRSLAVTIHDVQISYSPHPRVTLVAEVPFLIKELETMDAFGVRTEEQTQGVGDIGIAVVLPFIQKGRENSHVHVGFDFPTGSIRRGGDEMRLPFDSQIGNGTVDFEWGWTYRGEMNWLSWGGQAVGRHPIGRNSLHYREGSRFGTSIWAVTRIVKGLSTSVRLSWEKRNNYRKFDAPTDPIFDPSDNSKARGGTRLTVSPGLSLDLPQLGNQRIAVEVGIPVHQDLDGPQLEQDWSVTAGWQWGF